MVCGEYKHENKRATGHSTLLRAKRLCMLYANGQVICLDSPSVIDRIATAKYAWADLSLMTTETVDMHLIATLLGLSNQCYYIASTPI